MIVDKFSQHPNFPFSNYFEDVQDYIAAQEYWAAVLHQSPGFEAVDWTPTHRPVDVTDDMYTGLVLDVVNWSRRLQISLQTFSLSGDINMALKENGPVDPQHIPDGLDDATKERIAAGIPEAELRETAAADYTGFMSWVEKTELWHEDPSIGTSGLVPIRKLILTSEVSTSAEQAAVSELESFLGKEAHSSSAQP